jgi:hypothetical protein
MAEGMAKAGPRTFAALRLVDSVPTTTGVVIPTYQPTEATAGTTS